MLVLNAEQTRALAPMSRLVDCLEEAFKDHYVVPPRQVTTMPGGADRHFLAMAAFDSRGGATVKMVTVLPDNHVRGLPTIHGVIIVFSETGVPVVVVDGTTVTQLRTGAASALASKYLSRRDSVHLVVIGTGALAPAMAAAHCTVRPIERVTVWGRRPERVSATILAVKSLVAPVVEVVAASSLENAVRNADIVSSCTSSSTPVVEGRWLRSGTFIDLVGSYSPSKRESDDDVLRVARIFVDTFEGALSEAGDILDPLSRGVITRECIEGDLSDLVCGRVSGRCSDDEIILFKSVGTAIEDFAASQLVVSGALIAATVEQA